MVKHFICPHGHRWEVPLDGPLALAVESICCPECGAAAETLPPEGSSLASAGAAGAEDSPPSRPTASDIPGALAEHPRYRVLGKIGAGGMGTVYKAEHRLMNRPVALKVIHQSLLDHPSAVERFQREVKAAARLSHPHVVLAHDADQAGELHFLVMEFVEGMSLAELVKEKGPLPAAEACDYVRQALLGLQQAHERGMVHRDLKPHNLMRTPEGVVKVLDFGLARIVQERSADAALTESGIVMGTADYLAPEQAADPHQADIRADIYSLGCTLYFLLTGQPPFPGGSVAHKMHQHQYAERPALDRQRADLPPGLADVLRKMMAKRPQDRYPTPREAADALAPFTQPPSPGGRRSRRRLVAGTAAVLLAGLLAVGVMRVATDNGELEIKTSDNDVQVVVLKGGREVEIVDLKTKQTVKLRSGRYYLELVGGRDDLTLETDTFELTRGGKQIVEVRRVPKPPQPVKPDPLRREEGEKEWVQLFNGKDLTGWVVDGDAKNWSVDQGELVMSVRAGSAPFGWLLTGRDYSDFHLKFEFQPGERGNSGVALWAVPGEDPGEDKGHKLQVEVQLWEGIHLVGGVYVRSVPDGFLPPTPKARLKPMGSWNEMEIDARGKSVSVKVNGENLLSADLAQHANAPDALPGLRRPSGRVGLQSHTGTVRFRNIRIKELFTAKPAEPKPPNPYGLVGGVRRFDNPFQVQTVAVSPNGKYVLAGGGLPEWGGGLKPASDLMLRLWDLATGKEVRCFEGHTLTVTGVAFSPDGKQALSCSCDKTVRLWDVETGKELRCFLGHETVIFSVAFSPDGKHALTSSTTGDSRTLRLWDVATGKDLERFQDTPGGAIQSVAFSPDGRLALIGALYSRVLLWDVKTGKELRAFVGHKGHIFNVAFSPDGKHALSSCRCPYGPEEQNAAAQGWPMLLLWNVETARIVHRPEVHTDGPIGVAFSPDGRYALSGHGSTIRGWEVATGREIYCFHGHTGWVQSVAFTPDGRHAVSGSLDKTVRLWKLPIPPRE